jgi:hypothetical protein
MDDHKLKDAPGGRIEVHPGGRLTWITPTGQEHTTERYDYQVDPDPPPTPERPKAPPEPAATHDPSDDPPPF